MEIYYMVINSGIILLTIVTISLFFQGFYVGRRQVVRFMIVSLMMLLSSLTSVAINGVYTYSGAIFDMNVYEIVTAIVYLVSWWGLGYMISHLVLVRDGDIGKVAIMKIK
jgi:hypothetical protein